MKDQQWMKMMNYYYFYTEFTEPQLSVRAVVVYEYNTVLVTNSILQEYGYST
jgi:hypothetical protein